MRTRLAAAVCVLTLVALLGELSASAQATGSIITFTASVDGRRDIYALDAYSQLVSKLTTGSRVASGVPSPDGTRLVYGSFFRQGRELRMGDIVPNPGTAGWRLENERLLLADADAMIELPTWAPDSRRLGYVHGDCLHVIDVNERIIDEPPPLAPGCSWDDRPAWSPDGRWIGFYSNRDGPRGLYLVSPDGSKIRQIRAEIAYGGHGMAWSPDGLRLAFDDYTDQDPSVVVVVITPDGYAGGEHSFSETAQEYTYWDVGWSPDGLRLAFVAVSEGNIDIYTMKADGTELQRLTDHPADDQSPVWSPDSTQIAFISNRDEKFYSDVFVIDLATGSEKRLTWGAGIVGGAPVLRQLSWVQRAP